MSPEELLALLRRGEWTDFEAKAAEWHRPVKALKETISAFCTTDGGLLVLGVEEDKATRQLTVVGARPRCLPVADAARRAPRGGSRP